MDYRSSSPLSDSSTDLSSDDTNVSFPLLPTDEETLNGGISSDSQESTEQPNLRSRLQHWAVTNKVKHNSVNELLSDLIEIGHTELPKDSRTLLQTARYSNISSMGSGHFVYFGILEGLGDLTRVSNHTINMRVNIDGLPLWNSSKTQFWPILGLTDLKDSKPFAIACYCGDSKPSSVQEFLKDFVNEASILKDGFNIKGINYKLNIVNFNCDTPARAFVKCVIGHNGYYSCEKCTQKGTLVDRYVKLIEIGHSKRTDEDFVSQTQLRHHTGTSPLTALDVGMVTQFPSDAMHLVDSGVTKKLILYWVRNGDRRSVNSTRLSNTHIKHISYNIDLISKCIPSEFNRKPRSLKDVDRWKASEFRQFILYIGPIVLKDVLSPVLYNHFLCLHISISILRNNDLCSSEVYLVYVEQMLASFVEDTISLYGAKSISYNVHTLLHLPDDVRRYGPLDNFSCYPFENCLGQVKRLLRTYSRPLAQLSKRLSENRNLPKLNCIKSTDIKYVESIGFYSSALCSGQEYSSVQFQNFKISSINECDKTFQLTDKRIVSVSKIIKTCTDECILICNEIDCKTSFFIYPADSSITSMYKIYKQSNEPILVEVSMLYKKCILSWDFKVVICTLHKLF